MSGDEHALDKRQLRRSFDRAAATYDRAAVLQAEVRARLLERLEPVRLSPRRILDLGAGTGEAYRPLRARYRGAEVVGLDLSAAMLQRLRGRGGWLRRPQAVAADAEALPFADGTFELVFSNLTLQWVNDLDRALVEIARVLAPGGVLMFSTFGPDTLTELRAAWAAVDDRPHVNAFLDMHDVGDAMVRAGLADPVLDCERLTLTYDDARALMRDLKALGARNVLRRRPRGLTGRGRLARVLAAYEAHRGGDGRLPSTWEVVYGHAWGVAGPGPAGRPDRRGEVRIDAGRLRGGTGTRIGGP